MGISIFLLALFARLIYLFSLQDFIPHEALILDSMKYDHFAWLIATGDTAEVIQKDNPLAPIYVSFLSLCYSLLGHNVLIPKLIQIVLGALSCSLIYKIGETIWNRQVGFITGLIAAFYGIFIFYDCELLKASLANSFLIMTFFLLLCPGKRFHFLKFLSASIPLSLAFLLRDQLIIMVPLAVISLFWLHNTSKSRVFLVIILFIAVIFGITKMLTQTPFERLPKGGFHFYIGNNELANGSYTRIPKIKPSPEGNYRDSKRIAEESFGRPISHRELNQFWIQKSLDYIKNNPLDWLRRELRKLHHLVNAHELPNDENYSFLRDKSRVLSLPLFAFGFILPFALVGIFFSEKPKKAASKFLIWFLSLYSLILLLGFVTAAYRLPLAPPLILFAASGLWILKERIAAKKVKKLWAPLVALVLLFSLTYSPSTLPRDLYEPTMERRIKRYEKVKKRARNDQDLKYRLYELTTK